MSDDEINMNKVATVKFTAALIEHGLWGARSKGTHESTMDLYLSDDRRRGAIEWDIPALETTEDIGLWFDEHGELFDFDGIMELPREAVSLLRSFNFKVDDEFL